ncbi:MAG: hypothetical protein ACNI3A_17325 [Desulfovibrio sp.]|uniref:hypothetical protein n=1 Tax=Desulfovibrio sp. 7SRBS1 TaxID=3378064 RepID=UPI003B426230
MHVTSLEYKNHQVFYDLEKYTVFYKQWALSVFRWVSPGTQSIANIDSYTFSSLAGTIDSIHKTLKNGRINDAWALVRKYSDSVIINIYSNIYLDHHFSVENLVVDQINNWINGHSKLPGIKDMSQYILQCSDMKKANEVLIGSYKTYKAIRDRCNDHLHYNYYKHILLNDNEIYIEKRCSLLDQVMHDIKYLFFLHFSYISYIKEHYLSSNDYVDYLEFGEIPPENSQYWVAPFIQEMFEELSKYRPEVANFIREHTSMFLE